MSASTTSLRDDGSGADTGADTLFRHEARREGRTIVAIHGMRQPDGSVVVETTVTPAGRKPGEALSRPFAFPQLEAARRFVDETIVALEYLGCDFVD